VRNASFAAHLARRSAKHCAEGMNHMALIGKPDGCGDLRLGLG
jgi:hypothetical protein